METDHDKCSHIGRHFFIFMSCWSMFGVVALIHSLACLRMAEASEVPDKTVSLSVAIVFGPLYWIYFLVH